MADQFNTTPDDLVDAARALAQHLRDASFKVSVEPDHDSYIAIPTLVAKRTGSTTIVVVASKPPINRIKDWAAFAKSQGSETRVLLGLAAYGGKSHLTDKELALLKSLGVGIYRIDENGVQQWFEPKDLALDFDLPERKRLPRKIKGILAETYDEHEKGDWEKSFGAACLALEDEARAYIKKHYKAGRIYFVRGTKPWNPTQADLNRLPLGALRDAFSAIANPNALDSLIERSITQVNGDRVKVTHFRKNARARSAFRKRVPTHIWQILVTLAKIKGVEIKP